MTSRTRVLFAALAFALSLFVTLIPAPLSAVDLPALMEKLGSEDPKAQTEARDALRQAVFEAGSPAADPAAAAQMEEQLLPYTAADQPKWARVWVIRQLVFIGGEPTVQALAILAAEDADAQIRNEARETLAAIPLDSATAALEQALRNAPERQDALGAITSLAYRGEQAQAAVSTIAPFLVDPDEQLASETALALGKIGGEKAQAALLAAYSDAAPVVQEKIQENVLLAGLNPEAAAGLVGTGANAGVRTGAFVLLGMQAPEKAAEVLRDQVLADPEFPGRSAIVREAFLFNGDIIGKVVMDRLRDLPLPDQAAVLGAIADLRMKQYESIVLDLAKNTENPELRELALQALIPIAGPDSYEYLHQLYTAGEQTNLVQQALARIEDPRIDANLMQQVVEGETAQRVAAVKLLGLRNPADATALLNSLIAPDTQPEVLEAALEQIENIGNLETVQRLIDLIMATQGQPIQRDAQLTLKRLADNLNVFDVIWERNFQPAITQAGSDEAAVALILILDAIKTTPTVEFLGETAQGDNQPRREAALQTLRRWQHIEVGEIWLEILNSPTATDQEKKLAQSNVTRLLKSKDISGSTNDKVAFAVSAFDAAEDPEFQREILKALEETTNRREKEKLVEEFEQFQDHPGVGADVRVMIAVLSGEKEENAEEEEE